MIGGRLSLGAYTQTLTYSTDPLVKCAAIFFFGALAVADIAIPLVFNIVMLALLFGLYNCRLRTLLTPLL